MSRLIEITKGIFIGIGRWLAVMAILAGCLAASVAVGWCLTTYPLHTILAAPLIWLLGASIFYSIEERTRTLSQGGKK